MTSDTTAPGAPPNRLLLTLAEAAAALSLDRSTLYRMAGRGQIAMRKLGTRTRIERAELERFLRALPKAEIRPLS